MEFIFLSWALRYLFIISSGAYDITAIVAQPQQNAQSIMDIATLVFLHFWCNSNTWISTNPCIQRSEIHLTFASPSSGFLQRMQDCPNYKQVFHSFVYQGSLIHSNLQHNGFSWTQVSFSFRKVTMCDKSHIFFTKMWLYSPYTLKYQIKYLAQLSVTPPVLRTYLT